jgi:excisionase family DNA binding protein
MTETHSPPDARQLERLAAFLRLIPEDGPLARLLKGAALLETPPTTPAQLASDILHGAGQIAHFLYGHEKHRRRVYRLVEAGRLPHFRLGTSVCSRKSVLYHWIKQQENLESVEGNKVEAD